MTGCCSSFVYYAPELVLALDRALAARDWARVAQGAARLKPLLDFVIQSFAVPKGYLDSALDRLGGVASGVLRTSLYCRPPYAHATEADLRAMREWLRANLPEIFSRIESTRAMP